MPNTNSHGSKNDDSGKVALYLRVSSDEQRERQTILRPSGYSWSNTAAFTS